MLQENVKIEFMDTNRNSSGFMLVKLVLLVIAAVAGYILISQFLNSDDGQEAVDTVNSTTEKAEGFLNN